MAKYTKQKSGLYRTAIQLGYRDDGKPLKKYFSAPTIKELEQKIFTARSELASGLVLSDSTTFKDYAEKWLSVYKASKDICTRNMYKRVLTYTSDIGGIPIKKINRLMVQQIINNNSEHPRTCQQILLTLKQVFKSAQEDGLLVKSPCGDIELPRCIPSERRALTDEEKKKLRSAVLQPLERLMLLVLYGTGCRPSEAYALTKSDFDFKNCTVTINKAVKYDNCKFSGIAAPKTNSSIRTVIASESIFRGLKHVIDKLPHDNVFGGKDGHILNRQSYTNTFNNILKKAGLADSGITQYTLRHNFATECYYAGVSIKECMRQMGHSSAKMVMEVYAHLDEKKEDTRSKLSSMVL